MRFSTSAIGLCVLCVSALPACNRQPVAPPTHDDAGQARGDADPAQPVAPSPPDRGANLKQIHAAMMKHADAKGRLPLAGDADPAAIRNKIALSWRVQILPYLDQEELFAKFKLDEPWDSANNKPLIDQMPKVFESPTVPLEKGKTSFKVFTGQLTVFPPNGIRVGTIGDRAALFGVTDGTVNTIMAIEGGAPVIWTKPEDVAYDPKRPLPDLKLGGTSEARVVMCEGETFTIDLSKVSEKTLRHAIECGDGHTLGSDFGEAFKPTAPVTPPSEPQLPKRDPLKLDDSRTITLSGPGEGKGYILKAQSIPQQIVVEFTSSAGPVSAYVFKEADMQGGKAMNKADPKLALAKASGQRGNFVVDVPAGLGVWVIFREAKTGTSIKARVSNGR